MFSCPRLLHHARVHVAERGEAERSKPKGKRASRTEGRVTGLKLRAAQAGLSLVKPGGACLLP